MLARLRGEVCAVGYLSNATLRLFLKLTWHVFLSLNSLVERRIESVHAIIKRIGKGATFVLPPYVCAKVREPTNIKLLKDSSAFFSFCQSQWRRRNLFDHVLRLRFSSAQLARMSNKTKLQTVYQCDLKSEFSNASEAIVLSRHWRTHCPALQVSRAHLDFQCTAVINYFKFMLRGNDILLCQQIYLILGLAPPTQMTNWRGCIPSATRWSSVKRARNLTTSTLPLMFCSLTS